MPNIQQEVRDTLECLDLETVRYDLAEFLSRPRSVPNAFGTLTGTLDSLTIDLQFDTKAFTESLEAFAKAIEATKQAWITLYIQEHKSHD